MNDYLVTYDLNKETNRSSKEAVLLAALRTIDPNVIPVGTTTTWLLGSTLELHQVHQTIRKAIDQNDEIVVVKVAAMVPDCEDLRRRTWSMQPPPGWRGGR